MIYRLIKNLDDEDIPIILSAYKQPSITQFISIDEENYWKYITAAITSIFIKFIRMTFWYPLYTSNWITVFCICLWLFFRNIKSKELRQLY